MSELSYLFVYIFVVFILYWIDMGKKQTLFDNFKLKSFGGETCGRENERKQSHYLPIMRSLHTLRAKRA
jgi:hypothetical protein